MVGRKKSRVFHNPSSFQSRLALTAGDPSGIGKTILKKALTKLGVKKHFQFLVWTEKQAETLKIPSFQTFVFPTAKSALKQEFKESHILQIKSSGGVGDWLEEAGKLCLQKKLSALVTGPASKSEIKKNKLKTLSQTALLKKLCKKENVFMSFRGRFFNVILLTDHIPLKKVVVNQNQLKECLSLALQTRSFLKSSLQKKPLGLLGLNPHCGEGGLIGKEEKEILSSTLKKFSKKDVQGPLVPDSAFLKKNWNNYSFFIALYHDQGLIPFKMIHSHRGFAQNLGLPFFRLGVDHGTGENLKAQEISSESFFYALKEALRLIKLKNY